MSIDVKSFWILISHTDTLTHTHTQRGSDDSCSDLKLLHIRTVKVTAVKSVGRFTFSSLFKKKNVYCTFLNQQHGDTQAVHIAEALYSPILRLIASHSRGGGFGLFEFELIIVCRSSFPHFTSLYSALYPHYLFMYSGHNKPSAPHTNANICCSELLLHLPVTFTLAAFRQNILSFTLAVGSLWSNAFSLTSNL